MSAASHDRDAAGARRPLTNMYEDLRQRNARHAELARARELHIRIERALQAARQRAMRHRG
jgi:hypothetical protein